MPVRFDRRRDEDARQRRGVRDISSDGDPAAELRMTDDAGLCPDHREASRLDGHKEMTRLTAAGKTQCQRSPCAFALTTASTPERIQKLQHPAIALMQRPLRAPTQPKINRALTRPALGLLRKNSIIAIPNRIGDGSKCPGMRRSPGEEIEHQ